MGILKKRFSFCKSVCLLLGVLLLAGCTSGHSGETTTTAVGGFHGNGLPLESGTDEAYHLPAPLPRDTWNIELSVVKIEDELITIEVRDNDNLGYRSSSISQLERLNGENWEIIRKYDEKLA